MSSADHQIATTAQRDWILANPCSLRANAATLEKSDQVPHLLLERFDMLRLGRLRERGRIERGTVFDFLGISSAQNGGMAIRAEESAEEFAYDGDRTASVEHKRW